MDLRRGHDHGLLIHIYHKLGLWVPIAAGRVRGSLGPCGSCGSEPIWPSPWVDGDTAFNLYFSFCLHLALRLISRRTRDSRPSGTKGPTMCWAHL